MGKIVYSWVIRRDSKIPGTVVRSSTIPEQLGRISYLLTDKTGEPPGALPGFKLGEGAGVPFLEILEMSAAALLFIFLDDDWLFVAQPYITLCMCKALFCVFIYGYFVNLYPNLVSIFIPILQSGNES